MNVMIEEVVQGTLQVRNRGHDHDGCDGCRSRWWRRRSHCNEPGLGGWLGGVVSKVVAAVNLVVGLAVRLAGGRGVGLTVGLTVGLKIHRLLVESFPVQYMVCSFIRVRFANV
jgi:hypothetical protein